MVLVVIVGLFWLASGFYRVGTDEQGVVVRFGKYVRTSEPGLHYHLPLPIESVSKPKVTKVNRIEVGLEILRANLVKIHKQDKSQRKR